MTFRKRKSTKDEINNNNNENSPSSSKSKALKVYICTWNVNTKQPEDVGKLLAKSGFDDDDTVPIPDMCVFGFQEVNSKPWQRVLDYFNYDPWTNALTDLLSTKYDYVRLQSTRLVGIVMNVFIRRSILPHIRCCSTDLLRLGFFGLWGNKGANIVSLNIGGFDISLVNAHLSAHTHLKALRKLEYKRIMSKRVQLGPNRVESLRDEDYLLFFGDLNFRCESLSQAEVKSLIETKEYESLLGADQLNKSITKEKEFGLFSEAAITFPPSYKFKVGTQEYDTSQANRLPSWCDRILFQALPDTAQDQDEESCNNKDVVVKCKPSSYQMLPDLLISDHKPVTALFDIQISDWNAERHRVEFIHLQQTSTSTSNSDHHHLDIEYRIGKQQCQQVVTHSRDWIGVYPAKFKHSHDYFSYVWSSRIEELESSSKKTDQKRSQYHLLDDEENENEDDFIKRNVVIYRHQLDTNDSGGEGSSFVLGYYSYLFEQLIGVSEPFEFMEKKKNA